MAENTVFIHTNAKQIAGAIVGRHALKRTSAEPDAFDVQIIKREDYDCFDAFEGRKFLRAGSWRVWKNDDLQSFTPVRFTPPQLMNYENRAVVIDPDVFAVGDVNELFRHDMGGRAILACPRPGHNRRDDYIASSVMLLDCAKLTHWDMRAQFEKMFTGELDYDDWIVLATEPRETIGFLEAHWNDFDRLTSETRMFHNTKRRTQPWKTGLPIDFTNRIPWIGKVLPSASIRLRGKYKVHPDPQQEAYFFAMLKECVETGQITTAAIEHEMAQNHVRHDALAMIDRALPVDAILDRLRLAA
ncbi:MAG: hypothetical protein JRH16_11850 [Deltaproteobacteria bacterium]|nr:hypothetical protein [Deltaproteobacteria bacterium]MBW2363048.1 hypothetical protein [Deltaproteobacteria bacterium]